MRRGLITLLAAALVLTCAVPAEAAKRKVPRGFYGVMWNRAAASTCPEELHDAQFARMARAGRRVGAHRVLLVGSPARGRAAAELHRHRPRGGPGRGAPHRRAPRGDLHARLGGRSTPARSGSPPARPSDYAALPHRAGGALRPEGQLLGREPRAAEGADPALADLERAELRRLLARGGRRRSWVPGYAALLKASYTGDQERRPREPPWSWRACRTSRGTTSRTSTGRARRTRSTPWPSTRSPSYLPNVIRIVRKTRAFLRKHGQRRKPVWITEITWPASKGQAPGHKRLFWEKRWETTPKGMAGQAARASTSSW